MQTVWKYVLSSNDAFVRMKKDARLLTVGVRDSGAMVPTRGGGYRREGQLLVLLALVETGKPDVERRIVVVDTGDEVPIEAVNLGNLYVGTALFDTGRVQHVFDGGEKP